MPLPYFMPFSSGRYPVGAAEEEHDFLDRDAQQQHGQPVHPQAEAAVGRAAVAEEIHIEFHVFAQREHRYEQLRAQADEKGLGEDVKFYMDFFRYGCPPHGGFGLGVDRLTMLLLGIPIKEVMFLFRGPNRLTP